MINMDFREKVVIDTARQEWVASPMPGVWRKPLAREDAERGHATSIVRYEPGARFSAHDHPRGEEILVLEGVFSDETGHYRAGTYFRNPEGFRHAPFSNEGCVLLVKLRNKGGQTTIFRGLKIVVCPPLPLLVPISNLAQVTCRYYPCTSTAANRSRLYAGPLVSTSRPIAISAAKKFTSFLAS